MDAVLTDVRSPTCGLRRVLFATAVRVCVEAYKVSLRSGRREPMNLFHFIFRVAPNPTQRRVVQPDTYEEGMLYLEGRRRWLYSQEGGGSSEDEGASS